MCCSRDAKTTTPLSSLTTKRVPPAAPTHLRPRARRWTGQTGWAAWPSPVDLSEHDVERAEDGRDVGQQMALADEIHGLQMGKARRADLALVRLVGAIGDQIDAELALGRFHGGIDLPGGHAKTFGIELEMMDQRFHRALHLAAAGREDLVVLNRHRPLPVGGAQLRDALLHDANRLAPLFDADAVAIVAIAILADRNIEIHFGIAFVGLRFAQVPGGARAAHHHAGKTPRPSLLKRHHADIDVTLLEDAIVGPQGYEGIDRGHERIEPGLDVVDQLRWQILVDAADPEIRRMHAAAGGTLIKHHPLFALCER